MYKLSNIGKINMRRRGYKVHCWYEAKRDDGRRIPFQKDFLNREEADAFNAKARACGTEIIAIEEV